MNTALLGKTLRDTAPLLLIVLLSLIVFEVIYVRAMRDFAGDLLDMWNKRPAIKSLVQMLVGAQITSNISSTGLISIGLAHPLLFALTWAFILTTCTRVLAAEVDRGTADLLLTLPLSRSAIYFNVTIVWLLAGVLLSFAPLLGVWLGERWAPLDEPIEVRRLLIPACNLYALFIAVSGAAMLASAMASRRNVAVGVVLAALLISFLLNFLEQFWKPAQQISFLALLHYYKPLASVNDGVWPIGDLLKLLSAGLVCWLAGLVWFSRRDIPAA